MIPVSKHNTAGPDKADIVPILMIVGVVLLGFYKIFFGADFFVHQDQFLTSNFTFGNSIGNGWRPDKGFGTSFFYGDTITHAWSLLSFWEKIVPSQAIAYVSSVVFFDLLAGIAMYYFLRLVAPGLGRSVWLLCPLIIFTSHQAGMHYLRFNAVFVGVPLLLIVLYKYYSRPRLQHYFYFALVFWFIFVFGSVTCVASLLSMGFFFSVMYYLYYKESLKEMVVKFLLLFTFGSLLAILLSFWMIYPNLVETILVGYTREKQVNFPDGFNWIPNIKGLVTYLLNIVLFEWHDRNLLNAAGLPAIDFSYNVVAIFPLLLIFFFFRSANSFWEFSMKGLIIVLMIHLLLVNIPIYSELYTFIYVKSKTLINVYDSSVLFVAQITLITVFISEIKRTDLQIRYFWGRFFEKGIASLLLIFYSGLAVFCIFSFFVPDILPSFLKFIIEIFSPDKIGSRPKELLAFISFYGLHSLQNSMHWYSLVYFLISAVFMLFFLRFKWLSRIVERPKFFASLLLISAITMSWTVFPLNTKKLIWEEVASSLPEFSPTDRFYYTGGNIGPARDITTYKQKREVIEEGPLKRINFRYGYEESPGLKLHGHKSFTQRDVAEYVYHIFNEEEEKQLVHLRHVTRGPVISSELLDMGAVSYYYSKSELQDVPEYLSLCFKSKWLYIYKNLNAWPYYYLAERLEVKDEGKHLENVKRGTAYLAKDDYFQLPENTGSARIRMKDFSFGKMIFDFSGNNDEFLVVADSWHPFWKAYAGDTSLPVVKANEIFKGVRLPKGEYILTMEFDTSPYFPGVYISIIFWILFLSAWIWVYLRSRHKSLVNVDIS